MATNGDISFLKKDPRVQAFYDTVETFIKSFPGSSMPKSMKLFKPDDPSSVPFDKESICYLCQDNFEEDSKCLTTLCACGRPVHCSCYARLKTKMVSLEKGNRSSKIFCSCGCQTPFLGNERPLILHVRKTTNKLFRDKNPTIKEIDDHIAAVINTLTYVREKCKCTGDFNSMIRPYIVQISMLLCKKAKILKNIEGAWLNYKFSMLSLIEGGSLFSLNDTSNLCSSVRYFQKRIKSPQEVYTATIILLEHLLLARSMRSDILEDIDNLISKLLKVAIKFGNPSLMMEIKSILEKRNYKFGSSHDETTPQSPGKRVRKYALKGDLSQSAKRQKLNSEDE